eukprot:gene8243-48788_t
MAPKKPAAPACPKGHDCIAEGWGRRATQRARAPI